MKQIATTKDVDEALSAETAILFKYSMTCPISANARGEMEAFMEKQPDAPLYRLDVHQAPEASTYVAEKTGIEHESPQVIVLRNGKTGYTATHFDVRAQDLANQLG